MPRASALQSSGMQRILLPQTGEWEHQDLLSSEDGGRLEDQSDFYRVRSWLYSFMDFWTPLFFPPLV